MSEIISPMLRLFREGAQSYQPEFDGLPAESGDPQISLENVRRIVASGLAIREILVKPTGALVTFSQGEQYYAPGLRVGTKGPATEALARIAADAKFGSYDDLLSFYRDLPADWNDILPDLDPNTLPRSVKAALDL
jgi:hypothetical protein